MQRKIFTFILLVLILNFLKYCATYKERIVSFYPQGETQRETVVRIKFSVPVMTDKSKINVPLTDVEYLKFNPPLKGEYRWLSEDTLQFIPNDKLEADTKYQVIVTNNFGTGVIIKGRRHFEFVTPKFKVLSAELYFNYFIFDIGEKNLVGEVSFNYKVDIDDFKRYVKLLRNGSDFPYEITENIDNRKFKLVSANIKKEFEDQKFQLVISKYLPNAESGTTLKEEVTRSITLSKIPPFEMKKYWVERRGKENIILIRFNKIPDERYIKNFIVFEDEKVPYKISVDLATVIITGKFKYNKSYKIKIKKGLKAIDGSELKKEIVIEPYIKRPPREIKFLQTGKLLPVKDNVNIYIESYDIRKINFQIYRVPFKNIPYLLHNDTLEFLGKIVFTTNIYITQITNDRPVITEVNLKSFIKKYGKGLYRLRIMDAYEGWPRKTKWILGTDMGIVAKDDGKNLIVFIGSLKNFAPVANAKVEILNSQGETLLKKKSDINGLCIFKNYRNEIGSEQPWLITVEKDNDVAYLYFKDSIVTFEGFDIGGDPYQSGLLEAFLYPSRDLYRPGEKIHIATVVRKIGSTESLNNLPVSLKVYNPFSTLIYEENAILNKAGMAEFNFKLPSNVKTGDYHAYLYVGNINIGNTKFKIEEFIPQTVKVSIKVHKKGLQQGSNLKFTVKGINLFGVPAAKARVFATVKFSYYPFKAPGYKGFSFKNSRQSYRSEKIELEEAELDKNGIIKYECQIPDTGLSYGMLKAQIYAEVQPRGGRTVAAVKNVIIADKPYYIGVKKCGPNYADTKTPTKFEIVALNKYGKPVIVKNVSVYIIRKGWYNVYQKASWRYSGNYLSDSYQEIVLKKSIPVLNGKTSIFYKHKILGDYEIIVMQENDKISANLEYRVSGTGKVQLNLSKPYNIQFQLDKDKYKIGEYANLSIQSPFKGLLILTVEREKVLYRRIIKIKNLSQIIKIPVKKEFIPNAYIVGLLFRSYTDPNPTLPPFAYAAIPINVDRESKRLKIILKVPPKIKPDTVVKVKIKVPDADNETYLTLAVVEEGVLNITGFHVPKIFDFFMRKRRLSVKSYNTFSFIISQLSEIKPDISLGGGEYEEITTKHYAPFQFRKRKIIDVWSGIVKLQNKEATIDVPIGNYNGSVRFMVVAASKEKSGSAETRVPVYAPIIIQPTVPRAISPEDKLSIPVSLFNKMGKKVNVKLSLSIKGPLKIKGESIKKFVLQKDKEKFIDYRLEALKDVGNCKLIFKAKVGNKIYTATEYIGIRAPVAKETILRSGTVKPGRKRKIGKKAKYYKKWRKAKLFVSPYAEAEYLNKLEYLLRYPYGCLEQKISIAFPQLYISELADAVSPFLYKYKLGRKYVEKAIKEAEMCYGYRGFETWPGYRASDYLNLYFTHFLVEAKKKGYSIKKSVYEGALEKIKNYINRKISRDMRRDVMLNISYGLYILADANKPMRENMEYMKSIINKDSNLLSVLYLAAAYSKFGDKNSAMEILNRKKDILFPERYGWWGNLYVTDTAAAAILSLTLLEVDPSNPALAEYLDILTDKFRSPRILNTHELAWGLQVFAKLFSKKNVPPLKGKLICGNTIVPIKGKKFLYENPSLCGRIFFLQNTGKKKFYYSYISEAYPLKSFYNKPLNNGIQVEHEFFDRTGKKLNLKDVKQGDLVVERIHIHTKKAGNVVLVVLFPGGLEIENPRLKRISGKNWITDYTGDKSDYFDIREDRLLIFTDFHNKSGSRTYYFAYRAVMPGEFIVPCVFAEDMYNPNIYGRSKSKKIFITQKY